MDSVLAIREIEDAYLREVFEATKELASQRGWLRTQCICQLPECKSFEACHDVAAYEDITAEDNQDVIPTSNFTQGGNQFYYSSRKRK